MSHTPKFAIILPVYNEEEHIEECLESIRTQSFYDWECYVLNDHSTDNTQSIVEKFVKIDKRFILVNSPYEKTDHNGNVHLVNKDLSGISNMLNLGIQISNSKYIIRMDGDDIMLKNRLALTFRWMESHKEDDIVGFPLLYNDKFYDLHNLVENGVVTYNSIKSNIKPFHPTVCMRRKTVMEKTKYLYQQPYDGAEDTALWCHALLWGCRITLANTPPVLIYKGGKHNEQKQAINDAIIRAYLSEHLSHYKESNKMTVVIGFKNEGIEVEKTILSLLISDDNINIVLIDDASDDGFDYERVAQKFGCFYFRNDVSKGCAGARNVGVSFVNTPYFMLMDAHMRINVNQKDFSKRFVSELEKDPNQIVHCNTIVMRSNINEDPHFRHYVNEDCVSNPNGSAACGAMYNYEHKGKDFHADWCYKYLDNAIINNLQHNIKDPNVVTECISLMGADYATSKTWWEKIRGLDGLFYWGYDEPYLSLKTYLLGGKVSVFPFYAIGHLYRDTPVYGALEDDKVSTNLLFIQYLMSHAENENETDGEIFEKYCQYMKANKSEVTWNSIANQFNERTKEYKEIKEWLWNNATRKISDIWKLQNALK